MTLGIPQLIFVAMMLLGTGIILANHGKPRGGKYCFFTTLISDAITISLLYWGGFFG